MPTEKAIVKVDDGGPAFGGSYDDVLFDAVGRLPAQTLSRRVRGMSLRDYFAGQALAGMLASPPMINRSPDKVNHAGWAKNAYRFADAMLTERSKARTQG